MDNWPMKGGIVATDIGGTFTDLVAYDPGTGGATVAKVLTTSDLVGGINEAISNSRIDLRDVAVFKHGTTTAINTVLEHTGAKTALVTTAGFRDALEIRRGNRTEPFNIFFKRWAPLVPRDLRFEIDERIDGKGRAIRPLEDSTIDDLIRRFRAARCEAVAVCLINAYRWPQHESRIGERFRAELDCYVTLSHELTREYREYERSSTAAVNAYVGPRVANYVRQLDSELSSRGFGGAFYLMRSNGGTMTASAARSQPAMLMESGPAGGVAGCAVLARQLGIQSAISFDMGGTTAKCALIEEGTPLVSPYYEIGEYGKGFPLLVPCVDIVEVGAGGGSIAYLDELNALRVGPRTAGAVPGPACYGRGGTGPTVTDANVLLGRINSEFLLGGELPIRRDLAEEAVGGLASRLSQPTTKLAEGILRLAELEMASAVQRITLEKGRDPRDFALIAIGGAGPLHASNIARELHIPRVVVPHVPGNFSALGMLLANIRQDFSEIIEERFTPAVLASIQAQVEKLEAAGRSEIRAAMGDASVEVGFERYGEMRCAGQDHTVRIRLPEVLSADAYDSIVDAFHSTYALRYSHVNMQAPVEIRSIHMTAIGMVPQPDLGAFAVAALPRPPYLKTRRPFYYDGQRLECDVIWRSDLRPGESRSGPLVIEEMGSTTVIGPSDSVEVDSQGLLDIAIGRE